MCSTWPLTACRPVEHSQGENEMNSIRKLCRAHSGVYMAASLCVCMLLAALLRPMPLACTAISSVDAEQILGGDNCNGAIIEEAPSCGEPTLVTDCCNDKDIDWNFWACMRQGIVVPNYTCPLTTSCPCIAIGVRVCKGLTPGISCGSQQYASAECSADQMLWCVWLDTCPNNNFLVRSCSGTTQQAKGGCVQIQ